MQETLQLRQALQDIEMVQEVMFGMMILLAIETVLLFSLFIKMNNNANTEV